MSHSHESAENWFNPAKEGTNLRSYLLWGRGGSLFRARISVKIDKSEIRDVYEILWSVFLLLLRVFTRRTYDPRLISRLLLPKLHL